MGGSGGATPPPQQNPMNAWKEGREWWGLGVASLPHQSSRYSCAQEIERGRVWRVDSASNNHAVHVRAVGVWGGEIAPPNIPWVYTREI